MKVNESEETSKGGREGVRVYEGGWERKLFGGDV